MRLPAVIALGLVLSRTALVPAAPSAPIPEDFPKFIVPGHDETMELLRRMVYLHYQHYCQRGRLLPTVWDEWMSAPTLWPAVESDGRMHALRRQWADGLSARLLDPEGYVASHQHASLAHQQGWPFPFWQQGGPGTWGWHFSLRGVPHNWDGSPARTQAGWSLEGANDLGIADDAWNLELTAAHATVTTPPLLILPDQAPFMQLRWHAEGLDRAQPCLEWATQEAPGGFDPARRLYFAPSATDQGTVYSMIPVHKSPAWAGRITQLRLQFDNPRPGPRVAIQALFTQYDTRHNINNANFVRGCCHYFHWTRDLNFLRNNLQRLRLAMRYMMESLGGQHEKCIVAPFSGHDGRSGIELGSDGQKTIHSGRGIGNNYWDILPAGYRDAYATIHYYDALRSMAGLEQQVAGHPEWDLPAGPLRLSAEGLERHAAEVKHCAGRLFWNSETGRFVAGIDRDGKRHDYGFTFINCEAIDYDFATWAQAESIMAWLAGQRTVTGDTAQGADIYHWWFGPRSTTKRNIDWYGWYWYAPESLPWGGQVQDGGAVLGFSYHDLRARLKVRGPDNAWTRLKEIMRWFGDVQAAGGYRAYYKDGRRGTLQGGGVCGGLGMDHEFYESILVPQIVLTGFLGFKARADGFDIQPRLPADWPRLTVTKIHFQRFVLDVSTDPRSITIAARGTSSEPVLVRPPVGRWRVRHLGPERQVLDERVAEITAPGGAVPIRFGNEATVELSR